jgi:hypothetical protein
MLTTEKRLSKDLIEHIGDIHSYTTPMITQLDSAIMNSSYKFWVDSTLNSKEQYLSEEEGRLKEIQREEEESGYHFGKLK